MTSVPPLQGGQLASVGQTFVGYPTPPTIDVWLSRLFPMLPPDGDWRKLRMTPLKHFTDREDGTSMVGADQRQELMTKYSPDAIRKAWILHNLCLSTTSTTDPQQRAIDSQMRALADNFLMDAYLHWNYLPREILDLMRNHPNDPYVMQMRANLASASDSERPLCNVLPSGRSEVEELQIVKQDLRAAQQTSVQLQGNLSQQDDTIATLRAEIAGLQVKLEEKQLEVKKAREQTMTQVKAAVEQAHKDVAEVVAEQTVALREELSAQQRGAMLAIQQGEKENARRLREVQLEYEAKLAKTQGDAREEVARLETKQEAKKAEIAAALIAAKTEFENKLRRAASLFEQSEADRKDLAAKLLTANQANDEIGREHGRLRERLAAAEAEVSARGKSIETLEGSLRKQAADNRALLEEQKASMRETCKIEVDAEKARAAVALDLAVAKARAEAEREMLKIRAECSALRAELEAARGDVVEARALAEKTRVERDEAKNTIKQLTSLYAFQERSSGPRFLGAIQGGQRQHMRK